MAFRLAHSSGRSSIQRYSQHFANQFCRSQWYKHGKSVKTCFLRWSVTYWCIDIHVQVYCIVDKILVNQRKYFGAKYIPRRGETSRYTLVLTSRHVYGISVFWRLFMTWSIILIVILLLIDKSFFLSSRFEFAMQWK